MESSVIRLATTPNEDSASESKGPRTGEPVGPTVSPIPGSSAPPAKKDWRRFNRPGGRDLSIEDRFSEKVDKSGTCWIWIGAKTKSGYGNFFVGPGNMRAHRFSYLAQNGAIPPGMQLDHLCRNPICVNPLHLEPVTNKENGRRGLKGILRTSCIHGHPYTPENTVTRKRGDRECRICHREQDWRRRHGLKRESVLLSDPS